jgi:23S rRNA (guanine2445-N2)-methyltransferase / 23S rRNA (guanine2069-N7)-methyltransferase
VKTRFEIQVRTMAGLEPLLADELTRWGVGPLKTGSRVVTLMGDLELLYRINFCSRLAIRVLRPIATFPATDERGFYDGIQAIDWSTWMGVSQTLAINAHVHSAFSTHSLFIAQLAKDAIVDQFQERTGRRPSVDLHSPDIRISVNVFKETAFVALDSSGESLHRRGYRKEAGEAPLNEVLAAAIVDFSKWDGESPLVDPFCGSGTFAIEAALKAMNKAPGFIRKHYAFQNWPDFDASLFDSVVCEAEKAIKPSNAIPPIVGIEIDPAIAGIAQENAKRAGVESVVQLSQGDFFEWTPPFEGPGTLLLNPPYDERLRVSHVGKLWQKIGSRLWENYRDWNARILCGTEEGANALGLQSRQERPLNNGSIDCLLFDIPLDTGSQPRRQSIVVSSASSEESSWQPKAEAFLNRLKKNVKHLGKWARRESVNVWRVYDRDIPELPFLVDVYGTKVLFSEVPRNHDRLPLEHEAYLNLMADQVSIALGLPREQITLKTRKPSKTGGSTAFFEDKQSHRFEAVESNLKYWIGFDEGMEVGLYLDQRQLRTKVTLEAKGKDVLNLYGYTGSFAVCAASGGAASTVTVDSSRTCLEWAEANLELNGFSSPCHRYVRADVLDFLQHNQSSFDLCIVDPPGRSINRATSHAFELQRDHVSLLSEILRKIRPNGKVYFLTSFRQFRIDEVGLGQLPGISFKEITASTIPPDFSRSQPHRCWEFSIR